MCQFCTVRISTKYRLSTSSKAKRGLQAAKYLLRPEQFHCHRLLRIPWRRSSVQPLVKNVSQIERSEDTYCNECCR